MNELKRILPTVHLPLYKDTGKKSSKYLNIKSNILERTKYDISQILPP